MAEFMDHIVIWGIISFALYAGLGLYFCRVENFYCRELGISLPSRRDQLIGVVAGGVCFSIIVVLSRQRLVAACLPGFAVATASLTAVWRIDSICLIIPDRVQLAGLTAGGYFLLIQGYSEGGLRELFLKTAAGLLLVGLLWGLSSAYMRLRGSIGLGFGDIKLLAWLSLFVGPAVSDVIMISIGIGILQLVTKSLYKSIRAKQWTLPDSQQAFAFGPCIVLAAVIREIVSYA